MSNGIIPGDSVTRFMRDNNLDSVYIIGVDKRNNTFKTAWGGVADHEILGLLHTALLNREFIERKKMADAHLSELIAKPPG